MTSQKPLQRVLVPIGGNEADAIALRFACDAARKSHAQVFVIYVIEVQRSLPLDAELVPEAQKGEDILARAEEVSRDMDYQLESELLQAREVGPAIVDEAINRGADLIVMGLPYKRRFGEFTIGSTVPYVLKNAPTPVWIFRTPQDFGGDL
jgi:nucleotide-binding universal stress UspA family protein